MEKTLKALISFHGKTYPGTHSIDILLKILFETGNKIPNEYLDFIDLNEYAIEYRYDFFDLNEQNMPDRNLIVKKVRKLIETAEIILQQK